MVENGGGVITVNASINMKNDKIPVLHHRRHLRIQNDFHNKLFLLPYALPLLAIATPLFGLEETTSKV